MIVIQCARELRSAVAMPFEIQFWTFSKFEYFQCKMRILAKIYFVRWIISPYVFFCLLDQWLSLLADQWLLGSAVRARARERARNILYHYVTFVNLRVGIRNSFLPIKIWIRRFSLIRAFQLKFWEFGLSIIDCRTVRARARKQRAPSGLPGRTALLSDRGSVGYGICKRKFVMWCTVQYSAVPVSTCEFSLFYFFFRFSFPHAENLTISVKVPSEHDCWLPDCGIIF